MLAHHFRFSVSVFRVFSSSRPCIKEFRCHPVACSEMSFLYLEWHVNTLAQNSKRNHVNSVRIRNRFNRLCGSSVRWTSVMLTVTFCTSAFAADPGKNVVLRAQPQRVVKTAKKVCYAFTSTSGIPVPCNRLSPIPTTASPMDIYRNPITR